MMIDPEQVRNAITEKTKAIVPVQLYGMSADMDAILEIARERNVLVIEDASQAHGATFKGRHCGSFGLVQFSFMYLLCFCIYPSVYLLVFVCVLSTNIVSLTGLVFVQRNTTFE